MTNEDRVEAYKMRLSGYTWKEIATLLFTTPNVVERDLRLSLSRSGVNCCRVVYPALQHYISFHYNGNVTAFCKDIKYPRNKGAKILRGELPMNDVFISAAGGYTGLPRAEIVKTETKGGSKKA